MVSFSRNALVTALVLSAATESLAFSTTPSRRAAFKSSSMMRMSSVAQETGTMPEAGAVKIPTPPATGNFFPSPLETTDGTTIGGSAPEPAVVNVNIVESNSHKVSMLFTPNEAFQLLAKRGEFLANASKTKTFISSLLGGMYVGMGGMLSLAIAGNMPGVAATNPGLVKFVFAALFPVNLFVCLLAGGQLFTGNTANMIAAYCEKKAGAMDVVRNWLVSYSANFIGCAGFATLCKYCGVLSGGPAAMAAGLLSAKTSIAFGPILVRAIFCNWLVCLAVYLSMQAKDMTGKFVSIFLPISAFVSIGFEHSVANMFILPAGMMCSTAGISLKTVLLKNLLPVTLGNALSGSLLVGAIFSFMFGRLGEGK